jgi:hypothetical protein
MIDGVNAMNAPDTREQLMAAARCKMQALVEGVEVKSRILGAGVDGFVGVVVGNDDGRKTLLILEPDTAAAVGRQLIEIARLSRGTEKS